MRAPGTRAASARRRPGWDHQPPLPWASVARKPSQARSPEQLAVAGALPGDEVEGDLAGGGGEQHGEAEGDQACQQPVEADGGAAAGGGGAHPVSEVDHHEGQQEQPEGAGAVAAGEVGPDVRLGDGLAAVVLGALFGVGVLGAAVDGGGLVAADPDGARVVEHLGGGAAADAVDEEFEGGVLGDAAAGRGSAGDGRRGVGRGRARLRCGLVLVHCSPVSPGAGRRGWTAQVGAVGTGIAAGGRTGAEEGSPPGAVLTPPVTESPCHAPVVPGAGRVFPGRVGG